MNQSRLMELLSYDASAGAFTRKVRTSNRIKVGDTAGSYDRNGYLTIRLDNKTFKAHRLAWLYVNGYWPENEIDHINHVTSDNRIENLRDVTKAVNQQNRKSVRGCSKDGNRWKAQIRANGSWTHLGCFGTEHEAHSAYILAKNEQHIKARGL